MWPRPSPIGMAWTARTRPSLVIHGTADRFFPIGRAHSLAAVIDQYDLQPIDEHEAPTHESRALLRFFGCTHASEAAVLAGGDDWRSTRRWRRS